MTEGQERTVGEAAAEEEATAVVSVVGPVFDY